MFEMLFMHILSSSGKRCVCAAANSSISSDREDNRNNFAASVHLNLQYIHFLSHLKCAYTLQYSNVFSVIDNTQYLLLVFFEAMSRNYVMNFPVLLNAYICRIGFTGCLSNHTSSQSSPFSFTLDLKREFLF